MVKIPKSVGPKGPQQPRSSSNSSKLKKKHVARHAHVHRKEGEFYGITNKLSLGDPSLKLGANEQSIGGVPRLLEAGYTHAYDVWGDGDCGAMSPFVVLAASVKKVKGQQGEPTAEAFNANLKDMMAKVENRCKEGNNHFSSDKIRLGLDIIENFAQGDEPNVDDLIQMLGTDEKSEVYEACVATIREMMVVTLEENISEDVQVAEHQKELQKQVMNLEENDAFPEVHETGDLKTPQNISADAIDIFLARLGIKSRLWILPSGDNWDSFNPQALGKVDEDPSKDGFDAGVGIVGTGKHFYVISKEDLDIGQPIV